MINRRQLLSLALRSAITAGALPMAMPWLITPAEAAGTDNCLITIFLRGGCDGLNCVVPFGDDDYHRLRPTIRIPAPGTGGHYPALNLDGYFGLSPALRGLSNLYNQGQLAVLPAVHHAAASRSHFQQQATLERAGAVDGSGWLNRYLGTYSGSGELIALALGQSEPEALRGVFPVRVLNGLQSSSLSQEGDEEALLASRLRSQYRARADGLDNSALAAIRASGAMALQDLDFLRELRAGDYRPSGGADYPGTALGSQLRDAALLIKAELGLRIATIDVSGWDTHTKQGNGSPDGRQARSLAELDAGLAAFMADLGSLTSRTAVLIMTEFGRTAAQNANDGTDHGNAAAWFVLGGSVKGGIYHGRAGWPGLSQDQLHEGRALAHTLEFRAVMAELLVRHLGLPSSSVPAVLPGETLTPVGFM